MSSATELVELSVGDHPTIAIVTGVGPAEEYFGMRLAELCRDRLVAWLTLPTELPEPKAWPRHASEPRSANKLFGLRAKLGIALLRMRSPQSGPRLGPLAMARARLPSLATDSVQPRTVADETEAVVALRQLGPTLVVCSPNVSDVLRPPARVAHLRLGLGRLADCGGAGAVMRAVEAGDLDGIRSTVCACDPQTGAWRVAKTSLPCLALDDTPATLVERCFVLGVELICATIGDAIAAGSLQVCAEIGPSTQREPDEIDAVRVLRAGLTQTTVSRWTDF